MNSNNKSSVMTLLSIVFLVYLGCATAQEVARSDENRLRDRERQLLRSLSREFGIELNEALPALELRRQLARLLEYEFVMDDVETLWVCEAEGGHLEPGDKIILSSSAGVVRLTAIRNPDSSTPEYWEDLVGNTSIVLTPAIVAGRNPIRPLEVQFSPVATGTMVVEDVEHQFTLKRITHDVAWDPCKLSGGDTHVEIKMPPHLDGDRHDGIVHASSNPWP